MGRQRRGGDDMITKNFKQIIAVMLPTKGSPNYGLIPITDLNGNTKYLGANYSINYPSGYANTVRIDALDNPGIQVGSGSTAPTENNYHLESRITSGMSASTPTLTQGLDENGNPYVTILFTLTNTSSANITISEVGYVQQVAMANTLGGSCSYGRVMFDRTVLSNPVTVPANGNAAIEYTLKTIMPSS